MAEITPPELKFRFQLNKQLLANINISNPSGDRCESVRFAQLDWLLTTTQHAYELTSTLHAHSSTEACIMHNLAWPFWPDLRGFAAPLKRAVAQGVDPVLSCPALWLAG